MTERKCLLANNLITIFMIFTLACAMMILTGCSSNQSSPDDPVTLTMRHVYGSQTKSPLNTSIEKFNHIVGAENLLPWDAYLKKLELSQFKEGFLLEGCFDDQLLMLPIAKSTEAFYLNQTFFDGSPQKPASVLTVS